MVNFIDLAVGIIAPARRREDSIRAEESTDSIYSGRSFYSGFVHHKFVWTDNRAINWAKYLDLADPINIYK